MKMLRLCSWTFLITLGLMASRLAAETSPLKQYGYTVTIDIAANENGEPESLTVVKSEDTSTGQVLTKMALAMAMKTKLPPHLKDGKAVKFTARTPFFFPIEGDEGPDANRAPMPHPRADTCVQPNYPADMAARGEVGGAIFEMIVSPEGKLTKLTTLRASHPEFEQAARKALETWTFTPAQQDGKPVEARRRIAIVFETLTKMADIKWRIAPRPSLGSFVVIHDNTPPAPAGAAPAGEGAASAPAPTAAPAADATPAAVTK